MGRSRRSRGRGGIECGKRRTRGHCMLDGGGPQIRVMRESLLRVSICSTAADWLLLRGEISYLTGGIVSRVSMISGHSSSESEPSGQRSWRKQFEYAAEGSWSFFRSSAALPRSAMVGPSRPMVVMDCMDFPSRMPLSALSVAFRPCTSAMRAGTMYCPPVLGSETEMWTSFCVDDAIRTSNAFV